MAMAMVLVAAVGGVAQNGSMAAWLVGWPAPARGLVKSMQSLESGAATGPGGSSRLTTINGIVVMMWAACSIGGDGNSGCRGNGCSHHNSNREW